MHNLSKLGHLKKFYILENSALLIAEDIGVFSNLSLKFMFPINGWKICIDLRLFSKFLVELFLRPLRSKDVGC